MQLFFQFCAVLKSGPAPKVLGPKRQGQQQSTLWHFVQNSKVAVHDQTWLLHCRKHYASAVLAGDTVKVRYFGFRIRLISLHVFFKLLLQTETVKWQQSNYVIMLRI